MLSLNDKKTCLIVGLGNPGNAYKETRHNVGFQVVKAFADKYRWVFRQEPDFGGDLAQGDFEGNKVFLLMPSTFMNRSGEAVRRCIDYYKVPFENLLIVCDDVALPCGKLRIRAQGSDGGHNGLKSIEVHLGTRYYARLRIGVGAPQEQILADHVLGSFLPQEKPIMAEAENQAREILELWVVQGIAIAMQKANARQP